MPVLQASMKRWQQRTHQQSSAADHDVLVESCKAGLGLEDLLAASIVENLTVIDVYGMHSHKCEVE